MKEENNIPEIADLVFRVMPNATREEQIEATLNLRAYLVVIYGVVLRLEAEGRIDEIHDKFREHDKVEISN